MDEEVEKRIEQFLDNYTDLDSITKRSYESADVTNPRKYVRAHGVFIICDSTSAPPSPMINRFYLTDAQNVQRDGLPEAIGLCEDCGKRKHWHRFPTHVCCSESLE